MRSRALIVIALCLLGSTFALAQDEEGGGGRGRGGRGRGGNQPPPAAPETTAPDIPGVVAGGTKVQLIKEGFTDAQGIVAAPDGSVLFTERSTNKITKVDKDGNFSTYLENTKAANGIGFDPKGRLIGVRYNPTEVAVLAPTPSVLSNKFGDQGYGHPKDLVVDKKGGVYFPDQLGIFAEGIGPGVFYVTPDGKTIKVAGDIPRPSGVALSPDDKLLYVSDALGTRIKVMDVQPDGTVKNERNFVEMFDRMPTHSMADGMTVDAAGRLYVATFRGVDVISPEGKPLGRIPIPRQPLNLVFAGADKKTLYVLGGEIGLRDAAAQPEFGALYKIPMLTEGYKGRSK